MDLFWLEAMATVAGCGQACGDSGVAFAWLEGSTFVRLEFATGMRKVFQCQRSQHQFSCGRRLYKESYMTDDVQADGQADRVEG